MDYQPYNLRHRLNTNKPYIEFYYFDMGSLFYDMRGDFVSLCDELNITFKTEKSYTTTGTVFITSDLNEEQLTLFKLLQSELISYKLYKTDMQRQKAKDDSSFGRIDPILNFIDRASTSTLIAISIVSVIIFPFVTNIIFLVSKWPNSLSLNIINIFGLFNLLIYILAVLRRAKFSRLVLQYEYLESK